MIPIPFILSGFLFGLAVTLLTYGYWSPETLEAKKSGTLIWGILLSVLGLLILVSVYFLRNAYVAMIGAFFLSIGITLIILRADPAAVTDRQPTLRTLGWVFLVSSIFLLIMGFTAIACQ